MLHEYTKKRIGQLHKGNLNSAEIARLLDEEGIRVHRSTVFRYLRRKEGAHHPQKKRGRPCILTEEMEAAVTEAYEENVGPLSPIHLRSASHALL